MTKPEITIKDLYEGGYLLCEGFELKRVTVVGTNGNKLCTFSFAGDARAAQDEYRQGRATANVAMLKFTMKNLKAEMFRKIREKEKQRNKGELCSVLQEQRR